MDELVELLNWIKQNEFHIVDTHYAVPSKELIEKLKEVLDND